MSTSITHSPGFNSLRQDKDNLFIAQKKIVFDYLKRNTATASMVSEATGITQKNVTRYKRILEKEGFLMVLFKSKCKLTGFIASYLTSNVSIIKTLVR
jgi:DNA-binding MarR family transcriptional regulator